MLVHLAHTRREPAMVLVSLGDNGAQMKETVERVRERSSSMYTAGDRLALVLKSSLLKMHIARVERMAVYRMFDNEPNARAWLLSPADIPSND